MKKYLCSFALTVALASFLVLSCALPQGSTRPFNVDEHIVPFEGTNNQSDVVFLYIQGGPLYELASETISELTEELAKSTIFAAMVQQVQILEAERFSTEDLPLSETDRTMKENVDIIEGAVKYYKDAGKTVYVYGSSVGAFLVQELLTRNPGADGYIIMVGRLDLPKEYLETYRKGNWRWFGDDGETILEEVDSKDALERNRYRMASAFGQYHYTKRFTEKNLKDEKIIYGYGKTDANVGKLTANEIKFLEENGVTVLASELDHSLAQTDLNPEAFTLLDPILRKKSSD